MLNIKNLTKKFGDKVAVENLNLSVLSGQICAFIGHNGAGKTTTLKAICGIIDFEGEITVDGKSIKSQPLLVKKDIGFLPDNPDIYEHMKGIDYLKFIADIFTVSDKDFTDRVELYGKRLSIFNDLNKPISALSHGMKQKVAILSLLIHKPKLYILDEPFVGLDPNAIHEFKTIMKEECKNGSAFFYSTHVLEVAEKICSHVAIIKQGKLVANGKIADIVGDKSLEKLFLEMEEDVKDD